MTEQDKQGKLPKSDSGYGTGGEEKSKLETAVRKQYVKRFKEFLGKLQRVQFGNLSDQIKSEQEKKLLENYLPSELINTEQPSQKWLPLNEEEIKETLHFSILDVSIKDQFENTVLPANEGSAFLEIAKICQNKDLLAKVIEIISIEKGREVKDLLIKYKDIDGENILHCLGRVFISKYENHLPIAETIATYHYFENEYKDENGDSLLAKQTSNPDEDGTPGCTPAGIIANATGFEINEQDTPVIYKNTFFKGP